MRDVPPSMSEIQGSYLALPPRPTVLINSPRLSRELKVETILCTETFQYTGSFKYRAAANVASSAATRHILAASSGNFGQALAYACHQVHKTAIIVMPMSSSRVKIRGVEESGGVVEFVDTRHQTRASRVAELLRDKYPHAYLASAFDDPLVVNGNASLGAELADRLPADCQHLISPIGGGGLASGLLLGFKHKKRFVNLYCAEPLIANDAARSFAAGEIVSNDREPETLADGARTLSIGQLNFAMLMDNIGGVLEVPEDSIRAAVRLLFTHANLKVEPTGALAVAALLTNPERFADRPVCCVVSGGNVDPDLYSRLLAG